MSIACVVCSYKLPQSLTDMFYICNNFKSEDIQLYIICCEGDNIKAPGAKIIQMPEEAAFSICKCANVGIRAAINDGNSIVIKTDIDCVLSNGVLEQIKNTSEDKGFCYRYWEIDGIRGINNPQLNSRTMGSIALHSNTWINLHGYDARMSRYGYDDFAIYKRAKVVEHIDIKVQMEPKVYHISHEEKHNSSTINKLNRDENIRLSESNWALLPESEKWGIV